MSAHTNTETQPSQVREQLERSGKLSQGTNYSAAHLGALEQLTEYPLFMPALNKTVKGKVFLKELIGTNGSEISLNKLPAGYTIPFSHAHKQNEEVYIFLKGQGQLAVDDDIVPVSEGSCVRLAPAALRCLRNSGQEELYFIVIQAREGSLGQYTFDDGIKLEHNINW
ncbi:MAG TPA: cupin domain-containing protein [Candidatus Obscuribacter sp.]|nr:cupin domain-containing protein [Candidatus Obscuribacter sp.]HNA72531.1 cupin domain-containing protein [Candidatus Obscuribacter sp.]HND68555.1 cupin domain-containing protein [Candidatus Obscuribacter sp.]HNG76610.1 cupin domain-containing protein [Candidatus Obscuribacter sp.]HNM51221.1 cupin domain-containing protein [Candidatus Obscuribacter sp.]